MDHELNVNRMEEAYKDFFMQLLGFKPKSLDWAHTLETLMQIPNIEQLSQWRKLLDLPAFPDIPRSEDIRQCLELGKIKLKRGDDYRVIVFRRLVKFLKSKHPQDLMKVLPSAKDKKESLSKRAPERPNSDPKGEIFLQFDDSPRIIEASNRHKRKNSFEEVEDGSHSQADQGCSSHSGSQSSSQEDHTKRIRQNLENIKKLVNNEETRKHFTREILRQVLEEMDNSIPRKVEVNLVNHLAKLENNAAYRSAKAKVPDSQTHNRLAMVLFLDFVLKHAKAFDFQLDDGLETFRAELEAGKKVFEDSKKIIKAIEKDKTKKKEEKKKEDKKKDRLIRLSN